MASRFLWWPCSSRRRLQANLLLDLALGLGADGVLLKPVLVSELLNITAELLTLAPRI